MKWIRGRTLGRGSYGFVSRAITQKSKEEEDDKGQQTNLPPVFAVKSAPLTAAKSLIRENNTLDHFKNCPFIVHSLGCDTTAENGEIFYNIFLEYASAGCLDDRIKSCSGGLPEIVVARYTKSILTALAHIHKLGFVHCDVKPQNVLLFREGAIETAKLADFGSAYKSVDGRGNDDDDDEEEDVGQTVRGTLVYAAPESVSCQEYTPAADVWALGCTVLKMLTGKSACNFTINDKTKDVVFKIGSSGDIPEIPKVSSRKAQDFLNKCLIKDPKGRWSVDKLLDHPFVNGGRRRWHHRRLSQGLHELLHRVFHFPGHSAAAVHAC